MVLPLPPSASLAALSTPELHAAVLPISSGPTLFKNWATTFQSLSTSTFNAKTVEDVRMVVELARREGKGLRMKGSGHSPSDLVCTDGYLLGINGLSHLLAVDQNTKQIHVQGGIVLHALHAVLGPHDLAMSSLGSISDQTLSGALSTATHGSGVTFGNLSSTVTFLDLVLPLPDAPLVRVSRDGTVEEAELFKSALCGLGCVGVIVGVGMQVEKAFKLEEECWTMEFHDFVERWRDIAESGEHVRCWWFPQVGEVKVSRMNRTTKDKTAPPSAFADFITETFMAKHFHAFVLYIARIFPNVLPYHSQIMYALVHRPASFFSSRLFLAGGWRFPVEGALKLTGSEEERDLERKGERKGPIPMLVEPTYRVDQSHKVFNYDCGFPQYTYEASIPYLNTRSALIELEAWYTKEMWDPKGLRPHFPIEIRFAEKDDIYLSPTYGARGTYIGAIQYRPYNLPVPYTALFNRFESILLHNGARPHWAKSHSLTVKQIGELYPKFKEFLRVRMRVDPAGVLLNGYVRRHLLGETGGDTGERRWKARDGGLVV